VHHFCTLIGYGVTAINPYMAYETIDDLANRGLLDGRSAEEGRKNYIKGAVKGILKVLTKMGISTIHSYHGAQIFEAVGLKNDLIERYFTSTASRIEGIGLEEIALENRMRHESAYGENSPYTDTLESGGFSNAKTTARSIFITPRRSICCKKPAETAITRSLRNIPKKSGMSAL
jgi:glutamate synthase (ferredoxin)